MYNSSIHGRSQDGQIGGCHAADTPGLVLPSSNEYDPFSSGLSPPAQLVPGRRPRQTSHNREGGKK
jgi:hypothetical protein